MSRNNTGNPIGSMAADDFEDNIKNLDVAVNSDDPTWTNRFGEERPTLATAIDPTGLVQTAVEAAEKAETAAAAALAAGNLFDDTVEGLAAVAEGQYFLLRTEDEQVFDLYLKSSGSAVPSGSVSFIGPAELEPIKNTVRFWEGDPVENTGTLLLGFVHKADGVFAANTNWRATATIEVNDLTLIRRVGDVIPDASNGAALAFYSGDMAYLGFFSPSERDETVLVSDVFPGARFARASGPVAGGLQVFVGTMIVEQVVRDLPEMYTRIRSLSELRETDFLDGALNGYINLSGQFVESANWRATGFLAVGENIEYVYTGSGNSGIVANVAAFDENRQHLFNIIVSTAQQTNTRVEINDPAAKYIRASASAANPHSMVQTATFVPDTATPGIEQLQQDVAELQDSLGMLSFPPDSAYAIQGETLYLTARGILQDPATQLAWDREDSNDLFLPITPSSDQTIPVSLRAIKGSANPTEVASFPVLVTGTPVSPASPQNFICLGDSLTDGTANSGIQGAYVNELSRRLTGIGTEIVSDGPTTLGLSNIHFRGTRGNQPILHEGRGGWRAINYLNNATLSGLSNAFWNPETSSFDIDYYLETYGFRDVDTPSGVLADGSNLTMVILLGWNDVYNSTAAVAASRLMELVDLIKAKKPLAKFILVGLQPAPELNYKAFNGVRFVSQAEVFRSAIVEFGNAYKSAIGDRENVDFLQISHQFNPEIAYNRQDVPFSGRSSETISVVPDHVHPNAGGYAQIADAVYYKIVYDYCRG